MNKKGIASEKRGAKELGGKLTPNSGASWHTKGDIKISESIGSYRGVLIQNKATGKKSYSLKLKDLLEITNQALSIDNMPVLRLDFESVGETYIILPNFVYTELMNALRNQSGGGK
jgi:hypothetical protein